MSLVKEHKIEHATIDKLKPFPGNPKDMSPEKSLRLKNSVRKWGLLEPLNVWKTGRSIYVLDGNRRLEIIEQICEEDGNRLLEIPLHPIECKDMQEAMDVCLTLADPAGELNHKKIKKAIKKAGYKSVEEAQKVFSFLIEDTGEDEKSPQKDAEADSEGSVDDWEKVAHVQCPSCNVQFPQKKHRCKPSEIDKAKIWKE